MKETKKYYLKVLRIELEDLQEDIELLMEECRKDWEREKLTTYVFLENLTVFRNELLGVQFFSQFLDGIDPEAFPTLDAMIDHIGIEFRRKILETGLAEAVVRYIERKLQKVRTYVIHGNA